MRKFITLFIAAATFAVACARKIQPSPLPLQLQGAVRAAAYSSSQSEGECSSSSFPFTFFDVDGQPVNGVPNNQGICTFPTSNCGLDTGGRVGQCCSQAEDTVTHGGYYMYIAFAYIFIQIYFIRKYLAEVWEKHPNLRNTVGRDRTPRWIKTTFLKRLERIWSWGIWIGVAAVVVVPTQMRPSIQEQLNVSDRNILQGAEAFLIPYTEMFQFVEDIVNVKINYAINSGDFDAVNSLVHLGLAGSILTGVLASGLASILGAIPSVLQALTNPGLARDMKLYPGCDIIAAGLDAHHLSFSYWIIQVWKFVAAQINMVITGFLFGAIEFNTAGWMMAAGAGTIPLIWFTGLSTSIEPLVLLAWAEFSSPYVTLILSVFYLTTPLGFTIRDQTGVTLSISKICQSFRALSSLGRAEDEKVSSSLTDQLISHTEEGIGNESSEHDKIGGASEASAAALVKEGLCIMVLDLTVQLSKSLAIYLALASDAATAYQLTALESYLPSYSIAWVTGMSWAFKVFGTMFLSIKQTSYFFKLARVSLLCTALVIPLILGTTLPEKYIKDLALSSGQNACEYASSDQCVQFFTNVYGPNAQGGESSLFYTFAAFSFGASVESIFIMARAIIITLLDFRYILKSTMVVMIFYIAAIILASKMWMKQAISFWVAMYIPQLVLCLLFLGRLHTLQRRYMKREDSA